MLVTHNFTLFSKFSNLEIQKKNLFFQLTKFFIFRILFDICQNCFFCLIYNRKSCYSKTYEDFEIKLKRFAHFLSIATNVMSTSDFVIFLYFPDYSSIVFVNLKSVIYLSTRHLRWHYERMICYILTICRINFEYSEKTVMMILYLLI